MRKNIILLLVCFTSVVFGQAQKAKQTDNIKPFVLGVIDEIQSNELAEKRF